MPKRVTPEKARDVEHFGSTGSAERRFAAQLLNGRGSAPDGSVFIASTVTHYVDNRHGINRHGILLPFSMPSDNPDRDALYRQWSAMTCRWYRRGYPPGRNHLPDCLIELYESGEFGSHSDAENPFNAPLFAVAIEDTWSSAEYPEARFMDDPKRCVKIFQDARGHLTIPVEPVTLYRGVRDEFAARHMSWTGTLEVARWFADRNAHSGGASGGLVYRLTNVDPEHVLAQIVHGRGEDGRSEDEYVLDPFHLDERGGNGLIELIEDRR